MRLRRDGCLNLLGSLGALLRGLIVSCLPQSFGEILTHLRGEELGENVGQDTTLGDDNGSEELVQLLVVSDSELQVTGDDTGLLVVSGGVTGKLEDLSSEV